MMLLASPATKFLTQVGHFGDHSRNQRRSAPTLPHFTGIGAPLQRNPQLLLERGAPVDAIDETFHSTPLDVALWVWNNSSETAVSKRCYEAVALLVRAGAKLDPQHWYDPQEGRSRMMEKIHADPLMLAALRGEMAE